MINLPVHHLTRDHESHKCKNSPSWSVDLTNYRVIKPNDTEKMNSSKIIEPMLQSRGNITLLVLIDTRNRSALDQVKKVT